MCTATRNGAAFRRTVLLRIFGEFGAGLLSTSAWCSAWYVRVAEQGLKSSFERAHDSAACYRQLLRPLFSLAIPDTFLDLGSYASVVELAPSTCPKSSTPTASQAGTNSPKGGSRVYYSIFAAVLFLLFLQTYVCECNTFRL